MTSINIGSGFIKKAQKNHRFKKGRANWVSATERRTPKNDRIEEDEEVSCRRDNKSAAEDKAQ